MNAPSPQSDALLAQGRALCREGRLAEGAELFRKLITAEPGHALAHNFLGMALDRLGQPAEALAAFDRALASDPKLAVALANKADALSVLGRFAEALQFYDRALALDPDPIAWGNRGIALHELERYEESLASFERAIALDPAADAAFAGRTKALMALDRMDRALASADKAIALRGNAPEHHSDRGLVLKGLKRADEARMSFEQTLALDPRHLPALVNLVGLLLTQEKTLEALPLMRRALAVQESEETRNLFRTYVGALTSAENTGDIGDLLIRAISEPWGRPREFARAAASLVVSDKALGPIVARAHAAWPRRLAAIELYGLSGLATVAKHTLLRSLLVSAPVSVVPLERFLTVARAAMLAATATAGPAAAPLDPAVLAFYSALAQQCFINEYVFTVTPDELGRARALMAMLEGALASGAAVPEIWPVIVAAYFPLNTVPACKVLLGRTWPEPVRTLLRQQVVEPGEEQQLRSSISRLTEIDDRVSQTVRQQYEENPYPRWVRAAPAPNPRTLGSRLREMFPQAALRPHGGVDGLDILIAGCGTGQQSIEDARAYPGAKLLAIDLSLASLAYAKRNTITLALRNIEYAQADILKLGSIGRTFDYIAAGGVLHHTADSLAARRTLLSLLRPGGYMVLGFYSETARRHVVAAQNYLAERDFRPTLSDIRRGRQEILSLPDGASPKNVTGVGDFFTASECRDMLFHVQEKRFTLPQIAAFLAENDLEFIGFSIQPRVLRQYELRFPDDKARTNLEHWHLFELENPDTFISMYQFWVQKR